MRHTRVADVTFNKTDKPSDNLLPVNDVDLDQLDVGLQNKVVHHKPLIHSQGRKESVEDDEK